MSDIELPEPDFSLDGGITPCWYEHSLRAAILADREKRAQAAQGEIDRERWLAIREGHLNAADAEYFGARPQLDNAHNHRIFYAGFCKGYDATEASKPVQAEAPHVTVRLPGITAKQAAAVSIALCEALVDAGREFGIVLIGEQPEAPTASNAERVKHLSRWKPSGAGVMSEDYTGSYLRRDHVLAALAQVPEQVAGDKGAKS